MPNIIHKGDALELIHGQLSIGQALPHFIGVGLELEEVSLQSYSNQSLLISFAPSVDTLVCQKQMIEFNKRAEQYEGKVIFISADLPFAQNRFSVSHGIDNIVVLSDFRYHHSKHFGMYINSGALIGLCARAFIVCDSDHIITGIQFADDIAAELNYSLIVDDNESQ